MSDRSDRDRDLSLAQRAETVAVLARQRGEHGTAGRKDEQARWLRERAAQQDA